MRYSIELRQQLARSLSGPVASAVKSLAVPLHYLNEETDSTGYSLAKKYVMLLCRLDLLEVSVCCVGYECGVMLCGVDGMFMVFLDVNIIIWCYIFDDSKI